MTLNSINIAFNLDRDVVVQYLIVAKSEAFLRRLIVSKKDFAEIAFAGLVEVVPVARALDDDGKHAALELAFNPTGSCLHELSEVELALLVVKLLSEDFCKLHRQVHTSGPYVTI